MHLISSDTYMALRDADERNVQQATRPQRLYCPSRGVTVIQVLSMVLLAWQLTGVHAFGLLYLKSSKAISCLDLAARPQQNQTDS